MSVVLWHERKLVLYLKTLKYLVDILSILHIDAGAQQRLRESEIFP